MQHLKSIWYFLEVARHSGFGAASRKTGIPKSTFSKHVYALEEQLGVRLIDRTTRSFNVTEIGNAYLAHCETAMENIELANLEVACLTSMPSGVVRVGCPPGLLPFLISELIPEFLKQYPAIKLQMKVANRRIDIIEERIDIALRARSRLEEDGSLIMRRLGGSRQVLVASPQLLSASNLPNDVSDLNCLPTLASSFEVQDWPWELKNEQGLTRIVHHKPRLACDDFDVILKAALAAQGVALLPEHVCRKALAAEELVQIFPDWTTGMGTVHAVVAHRKSIVPAVRLMIDFLAEKLPPILEPKAYRQTIVR